MSEHELSYENKKHEASLNNMRLSEKWCDVTIKVGEEKFRAHRVILASRFEYFDKKFLDEPDVQEPVVVDIKEGAQHLEAFITYAYTDKILLKESNALDLLKVAHHLGEKDVKTACADFSEKHIKKEEAFRAFIIADEFDCQSLKNVAKSMIISNFVDCSTTEAFLNLDYKFLASIVEYGRNQSKSSQRMFFEGIMKWIMHDVENRKDRMNDLLKSIDITELESNYLIDYFCENVVDHHEEHGIIENIMRYYKAEKEQRKLMADQEAAKEPPLLIQGWDSQKRSLSLQLCNLSKKKWDSVESVSSPTDSKYIHIQSVIVNGECYYIDHNTADKYALFFFDPKTKKYSEIPSPSSITILRACAVYACSKFIYLCGGDTSASPGSPSDQVLRFDPQNNNFETLASMKHKRSLAAAIFFQGSLYVLGGRDESSVEKYDADTNSWTACPSMCEARWSHAVAILGEKLYACGGMNKNSVEVYDPLTNSWQPISSMKNRRHCFTVIAHRGKLVAIGGEIHRTVEVYDPDKDQWHFDNELTAGLLIQYPRGGFIPRSCIEDA